jgi:hypothetical protein
LIIRIDEQYRVTTDPYQWIIQKRRFRRGEEDWQCLTYHPSLDSAIQSLRQRLARASDAQTVADALRDITNIDTTLSQALAPRFEALEDNKILDPCDE